VGTAFGAVFDLLLSGAQVAGQERTRSWGRGIRRDKTPEWEAGW
jgi:hypothetical protein